MTLRTARLTVRPFVPSDLPDVSRLLDDCFGPAPASERRAWLDWTVRNDAALAALHQPPYGDRAVTLGDADGPLVGSVGLVPLLAPFGRLAAFGGDASARFTAEVGLFWAVEPGHRRRGYASEAAAAMAEFAFGTHGLARVVAGTEHDNAASIATMRRLGMTVERNPLPDPPWFQTTGVRFAPPD